MLQEIPILLYYLKDAMKGDLRYLRFFWEHFMTGWSARDLWSLDLSLAKHILPQLESFRALEAGNPEEWNEILDKMIFAFKKIVESDYATRLGNEDKIQEGLELFGKYYRGLWY